MTGSKKNRAKELFDLSGRVAIVTGGAGFLGNYHGAILAAAGAHVVLLDLPAANPAIRAAQLTKLMVFDVVDSRPMSRMKIR